MHAPTGPAPTDPPAPADLLVACLCAQWCGTCRDYRAVFDAARERFGGAARFVSVDIEDDDVLPDGIDVDDFPTLLIARGPQPLFFGPITPQPQTLARLVAGAVAGDLAPLAADPARAALLERVRRLAAAGAA